MTRFVLAAALGLAAASRALALEGIVVLDESGEPVANAEVVVIGRAQTAHSGPDGRFVLVPDPRPPFELLVILPGGHYAKPMVVEELAHGEPLVIRVQPLTTEMLTIDAGAAPDIDTSPAGASRLVPDGDLEIRQPRTLYQSLENVPGVSNVSEGQASVPAVRGLAQGRSLILIDGARVTSERRAGPSATFLDPFILQGVEISRGPGGVAYGSDAFGGVIYAKTKTPEPGGDFALRFSGDVGAGVPQVGAGLEIESGLTERSAVLVAGHYRGYDDYDSPEGEVLNSGSSDQGFLTRYAQVVGRGVFSAGFQSDHGNGIERPRTNSDVVRFYYPEEDSNRFTTSYDTGSVAGFDSLELSMFFGTYGVVTDQDTFPTPTEPRHIERADVSADDFGARGVVETHIGGTRLQVGLDIHGRSNLEAQDVVIEFDTAGREIARDVVQTVEDADYIDSGVFVSAEGDAGRVVSLAGGLRGDWVSSTNQGGYFGDVTVSDSAPSGFLAVTLGPFSGFTFTCQGARGFRDARLSDRFFRGVTGRGFITGNPDLEPETSDQFDVAVRWSGTRWNSALYLYNYRFENMIERYEEEEDFFFFRNRGSARIRGVEIEAQAELSARVSLQVGATVLQGETLDDGAPLDDIPPPNLFAQVRKGIGERAFVQVRGALFDDDDEPGPNEVATSGYGILDAAAGWTLTPNFELQLLGRNLLDESYALSNDRRSPLAPGISVILTAIVTY